MATEFGCAWLHIHGFDELNEKSERHFPTFPELRGAMYEESIRFFTDFFQSDRSVLNILDADYTFLNEALAKHYGIPGVKGAEWRRVDGVRKFSRGGFSAKRRRSRNNLAPRAQVRSCAATGFAEVLLGEKLPRPPKDVPRLPEDEAALEGLTVRQLVEKHSSDPHCAGAMFASIRMASLWKASTPSAAAASATLATAPSKPKRRCWMGVNSTALMGCVIIF